MTTEWLLLSHSSYCSRTHRLAHAVTHLEVNFNVLYIVWSCQICKEIRTHLNMLLKIEKTKAAMAVQAA